MSVLFSLLIFVIVFGLIYWIVTQLPIPDPFKKIAIVVVLVIGLLYLLAFLFGLVPVFPVLHYR